MVIHLWGKFWMAAWRGRRALTWITGVVAFGASVVECFTGYVSQQNFDSQWISTNGKDAFNATGIGAFFNVMNFGQMLLWHVVLVPIILIALVGAHVLLVRVRGVSHPLPAKRIGWRDRAAPQGRQGGRRRTVARPDPPLRHPQGRHDRHGDRAGPGPDHGGRAVLAGRAVGLRADLGQGGAGRLPRHRRHRTRRHRPGRVLRPALQQRDRRGAAGRADQLAEAVRRHPARQRRPGLRRHAAEEAGPVQPGAVGRARHLHQCPGCPAAEVGHRLRERGHQGQVRQRHPGGAAGQRRARPGDDGERAEHGAQRRPGLRPARRSGSSTAPTSPSRCCSSPTAPTTPTWRRPCT